ncbi:DUF397 domain-containing protein [Nocardiopsis sp. NPDC006198]|uniref:DUF397 domain-containing protein n=1 Tax=Nocardiopsis sp. NPDC006198 TaxID=3154472 RepID=UPI0033B22D25
MTVIPDREFQSVPTPDEGWRKSSYSGARGDCVEVKGTLVGWHKPSYSDGGGGNCVEVAESEKVLVRDTQNRNLGHLEFAPDAWGALLGTLAAE